MGVESRAEERGRAVAERLRALLAKRASGADGQWLAAFARLLVQRGAGWIERLSDEDAAALVTSAYRFYSAPGPDLRVRVVTPTYADEGWDSPVTILETAMPDRPFIVDTIRERLRAAGLSVRAFLHPIVAARRDATGRLEFLGPVESTGSRESFTHIALEPIGDAEARERLAEQVRAGLEDVRVVTDDFPAMVARARAVAAELEARAGAKTSEPSLEAAAVADFVRWLIDGAFVFLGYREYALTDADGRTQVAVRPGSGLGLLRREDRSALADPRPLDELPAPVRERLGAGRVMTVAKTITESPVHRRARMEDIGIRQLDVSGNVIGERRFLGLFTSRAQAEEASDVPLLRKMLREILAAEQVLPGSHDFKEIVAVFNALPKSELLASTPADVRADIRAVLAAMRAEDVAVSVRPHADSRRVAVLVVMPMAHYSGEVVREIRDALATRLGGAPLEEHVRLGLGPLALLHFALAADATALGQGPCGELTGEIVRIVRTWDERLAEALIARHGPAGEGLAARFAPAFPDDYRAAVGIEQAAEDVSLLAEVITGGVPRVRLRPASATTPAALRLYVGGPPPALSECMPILENLGLRTLASDRVAVPVGGPAPLHVLTFHVEPRRGGELDAAAGERLADAVVAVLSGRGENDVLNRLVLDAGLGWRAVAALRAYAGYAVQAGLATRPVVLGVLAEQAEPARLLFECFAARFAPSATAPPAAALREQFLASLEAVQLLRDDLLLRALLDVVEATVRTTFFAPAPERDEVAIKIRSRDLTHLPLPRPLYEIWVHGPAVEGIHLRSGKVARGGLRLSDRPDDFRTEVLGLMRTQTVKNAVIVPGGAKGGFVVKGARDAVTVRRAYQAFVRALLALTDNLVAGRVVHPRGLVIHDEPDPYLVVAADKGTATFSDTANAVAAEYGFWLGDAFASGGSQGYDHKALGITARGAWECARVHARDLGLDIDTAPLTVAGIGDMGGDVFGNALKRAPNVRLRAAFNHQHVFLDPDPDAAKSFAERLRCFNGVLGWGAYDPSVLSPGGAVVPRAAKKVTPSPEAAAMLGLAPGVPVSGEHLAQAVLTMDVDLLFNGGIGTYVGATGQPDADIRDAVNDAVRVRASALRTRIVAEGGNLGLTQQARVEYALGGGRINTDAIDNSAGVDLSDHEVNLKICLGSVVESGVLGTDERNELLRAVSDEVVASVVAHNRSQSLALGLDQLRSRTRLIEFRELMTALERAGRLDRVLEGLPDRDAMRERRGRYLGLTRPELAVMMAHAKLGLRADLLASGFPDDPIVEPLLMEYFPAAVRERFPAAVRAHPLRREIVATALANTLVDRLGATFVHRVGRDTGSAAPDVARAASIAWEVAAAGRLVAAICRGASSVEAETTCQLALERVAELVTKWVLGNTDASRPASEIAEALARDVGRVRPRLPDWLGGAEAEAFHKLLSEHEMTGMPAPLARHLATAEWLPGALDVVTVARAHGIDPEVAAASYYALGQHIDFAWLFARLGGTDIEDPWARRAAAGLVDDVLRARRRLTAAALAGRAELPARALATLQALTNDLRAAPRASLPALQVVVRELGRLADTAAPELRG